MANNIVPVLLNRGLDTVTPPMLAEPGTLIDCLNYEMTTTAGYKRIDGYERFDGYPNGGGVTSFYRATITAVVPADQSKILPGAVISRPLPATSATPIEPIYNDVGVIVATDGVGTFRYVPYDDAGVVQNGDSVVIRPIGFAAFNATTSASTDGKSLGLSVEQYNEALRSYGSFLRQAVTAAPGNIAGMWWHRDNLFLAVDAPVLTFINSPAIGPYPQPGTLLRHKGMVYRVAYSVPLKSTDAPSPGKVSYALIPLYSSGVNDNNVVEVDTNGNVITTFATGITDSASASGGEWAYAVKCRTPSTSTSRGYEALTPVYRIPFDAGSYGSSTLPADNAWTIQTSDGSRTISTKLVSYEITEGNLGMGNAKGYAYVTLGDAYGGSSMQDNWEFWYGGVRVLTVNLTFPEQVIGPAIAGTARLSLFNTRYQYISANFYGNDTTRTAYVVTGASRGFWASNSEFGPIVTQADAARDNPKYVAYHASRLALGYEVGSVVRSVAGEPLNFSGLLGASEIATGDKLTGMVEMPGDVLAVFGLNSIRRISSSNAVSTISASGGAFDYTVAMLGSEPIYTSAAGISLLSQTDKYGDFYGERASEKIHNWLRPRLLLSNEGFETGGVACAYPVRNKNQYRLCLKNGDVICLTYTSEGFKATRLNYGIGTQLRVPFAWSSSIGDDRKEHVHVAWDATLAARGIRGVVGSLPNQSQPYELDSGWGFDGSTFRHYFDVAHTFVDNGSHFTGIEYVRLHGQSYGIASLNIKAAGIEDDYDQDWNTRIQDISLPRTPVMLRGEAGNFTNIVDHANWGLGVKLRVEGSLAENLTTTEPSHTCQVLVLQFRSEGAQDNG